MDISFILFIFVEINKQNGNKPFFELTKNINMETTNFFKTQMEGKPFFGLCDGGIASERFAYWFSILKKAKEL